MNRRILITSIIVCSFTSLLAQKIERGTFTLEAISEGIYQIQDYNSERGRGTYTNAQGQVSYNNCSDMYLIVGNSKALLVDLSNNVQWADNAAESLRSLVSEYSRGRDLIITVTHNHGDHLGMLHAFVDDEKIRFWIPRADFSERSPFPENRTEYFNDNASIDLGGTTVKTLKVEGHTPGSTVFFVDGKDIVFTGDAIGSGSGVWIFSADAFALYRQGVNRLINYINAPANGINKEKLIIYGGHSLQGIALGTLGMNYILDMKSLIERIEAQSGYETTPMTGNPRLDTHFRYGTATITWSQAAKKEYLEKYPVLTIEGGRVQGVGTSTDGVIVYKGIPYAAPPVGDLRWREPQPVLPWEGVKIADKFGAAAIQNDQTPGSFYHREFFADGDPERSEDCLFLNIWTPAAGNPQKKLPVAMWVHGGAYTSGFGHEIEFDGEQWAKRGVILVTINYRLGIYGFLAHPLLSAESPHRVSGNYGILDQLAAIKWIKRNISNFGGDPDNLMIFGQSAGAGSVQTLVASPLSAGLIQKAIIQSGGGLRGLGLGNTLENAEESGQSFFDAAGLTTLEQMRNATVEEISAIQREAMAARRGVRTSPVVDGYLSTGSFSDIVIADKLPKIPYMIGYTADDFGNMREPIIDFSLKLEELGRDGAYCYLFERPLPGDDAGAFHSAELWYIFGTLDRAWRPFIEADHKISEKMLDYWTNFAKNGNPNGTGLPQWKPYTARNSEFMIFNIE